MVTVAAVAVALPHLLRVMKSKHWNDVTVIKDAMAADCDRKLIFMSEVLEYNSNLTLSTRLRVSKYPGYQTELRSRSPSAP